VPTEPGALVDRLEIAETLCRYASAVDARDYDLLRTVFADDVEATYGEHAPMHGVDEVVDWIAGYGRQQAWQHHLVSVYRVSVEGDAATALTYVTATQAASADPEVICTTHGRYDDSLRRVEGAWRITQRRMDVVRRISRNISRA
jgi:SnoaL-like domain